MPEIIVEARNITKYFPGVLALDAVNICIQSETVHCIIGENGAGKSTLIKILTGVYTPDKGHITILNKESRYDRSVFNAVAYVPQEIDLFPHMSVAENLFMPFNKSGIDTFFVSHRLLCKNSNKYLEKFRIKARPDQLVCDISISNQQLLQIARASLQKDFRVLLLDEPTTALTRQESDVLFEIIKEMKHDGKAIVFISHKLNELFAIGDIVSVLRNGVLVGNKNIEEVEANWVVKKMSGEKIDIKKHFCPTIPTGDTVLKIDNLSGIGFHDISLSVREGEIVGFAGLIGAGRSELFQAVFGYTKYKEGMVSYLGDNMKNTTTHSVKSGIMYVPEDRKRQGVFSTLSVQKNIGINAFDITSKCWIISRSSEEHYASNIIKKYHIKTSHMKKPIMFLSGGNQQKVIIGRVVEKHPKLIIFDEPTKGIDIKTKIEIYTMMQYLAEKKRMAIVLISSELDELIKCSNRIITLYNGKNTGEFFISKTSSHEKIFTSMIGLTTHTKKETHENNKNDNI